MKLHLFILFFATAITAARGYRSRMMDDLENIYEDEALEALEGMRGDEGPQERLIDPWMQEDAGSGNDTCDCDAECENLHATRLPHNVRVSLKRIYLTEKFKLVVFSSVCFVCFFFFFFAWTE